jgi:hypothetical protein
MRPAVISYLSSVRVFVFGSVSEAQQSSFVASVAPHVSMPGPVPFAALHEGGSSEVAVEPSPPSSASFDAPPSSSSSPPPDDDELLDDEDDPSPELLDALPEDDALASGSVGGLSVSSPPQAAKTKMHDAIESPATRAMVMIARLPHFGRAQRPPTFPYWKWAGKL